MPSPHLSSVAVCSIVERRLSSTVKIGAQCSLKKVHIYLPVLSKEKYCMKENGFIILREFSISKIQYSGLEGRKKKTKQMKYFRAWQFYYFPEIGIQVVVCSGKQPLNARQNKTCRVWEKTVSGGHWKMENWGSFFKIKSASLCANNRQLGFSIAFFHHGYKFYSGHEILGGF